MEKSVESKTINGIKVIQQNPGFAEEKPCSEDTRLRGHSALYLFLKKEERGQKERGKVS